jgi:uncharacterized protein YodC (DUF2158 family)
MARFAVGDLVRLKSGGSNMTVQSVDEQVLCAWFDGNKLEKETFPSAMLESVHDYEARLRARQEEWSRPDDYDPLEHYR